MLPIDLSVEEEKEEPCKGLFYRYTENIYTNTKNECIHTQRMKPLLRRSCKGCSKCEWLRDQLHEDIRELGVSCIPNNAKHFDIFRLKVLSYSTDWESGHIDDVEVGFDKVPNEINN